MRADGEWGEFFPASMSPFGYNETVAQENHSLSKEAVLARGWKWSDDEPPFPVATKTIKAADLLESIDDIPDDILNWAIECQATKRPFKIIKQKLEFYRKMQLPIPHLHPDERHRCRMAKRNPRKLWNRVCHVSETDLDELLTREARNGGVRGVLFERGVLRYAMHMTKEENAGYWLQKAEDFVACFSTIIS